MKAYILCILLRHICNKVAALVWHCLVGTAPVYLQELCRSVPPWSTVEGYVPSLVPSS